MNAWVDHCARDVIPAVTQLIQPLGQRLAASFSIASKEKAIMVQAQVCVALQAVLRRLEKYDMTAGKGRKGATKETRKQGENLPSSPVVSPG